MPLTKDQQAELERLQAEQAKPEPRTESGLAGLLHTVLDVVSGTVAHLPGEVWADLHSTVESELGAKDAAPADEAPADEAPADGQGSSSSGASSSKGSSSSKGKASG